MALRGNLRDFSLPDVFQLVQLSGKTGVLRIAGPEAEGSIWFRDGEVFFAQSNWRREQLGERLVAAQRITPAALARALELRSTEPEGGRRLGEILVNEGYITPQVLETFVQEQIQDTIFDLMRWDEGDFDFEVLPDIVHEDIGLSVSVENIVMEGSRRLEEWQRIKKKVPSTDMVFKMATAPGEGTFEISLKPVEWALLLLIDGTRSVRELAVETHSTDFDVARVIYGLFSAGLLEVPADDEIERLRADRARREDKRAKLDAERAAIEQAQMDEALDLEAQLVAQAEARRETAESVPAEAPVEGIPAPVTEAVIAEADEGVPSEPAEARHVPEEPEFLAGGGEAPSQDDMAVFEQMMASVLSPQEATTPVIAAEPEPEIEAELVPGLDFFPEPPIAPAFEPEGLLEPGVTAEEGEFEAETPFVPYAPAFDAEEEAPVAEAEGIAEGEDFGAATIEPADIDLASLTIAELEALTAAAPESEPVQRSGDFEADLRSLGLGEYPEELLQARLPGEELLSPEVPEGTPLETPAEAAAGPVIEPVAEPAFEPFIEPAAEEPAPEPGPEDDLDSLLASLGEGPSSSAGVIASDTDFGTEPEEGGGYISTDAFLAEFDDSSLSSGLGDELTALTGGATGRARPVATVNKLPEAGEGPVLHRDQMVDRALLEQIIEGIENL